jgi:hypothetical protein
MKVEKYIFRLPLVHHYILNGSNLLLLVALLKAAKELVWYTNYALNEKLRSKGMSAAALH